MKKYAVLSMDVEDWYHLEYFKNKQTDKHISMLDGFTNYINLLNRYEIQTTFFILSELVGTLKEQILFASNTGHEIACHGKVHTRPLDMGVMEFEKSIHEAKDDLSKLINKSIIGYRAPCYCIDNERYEAVKRVGFRYSSSLISIGWHPLYGKIDLSDFSKIKHNIYRNDKFYEFELPIIKLLHKEIAISGGGWVRLFPWSVFMKPLIKNYLEKADIYILYIHPFELSNVQMPQVLETTFTTNIRARKGLHKVAYKIEQLIELLIENRFTITSFANIVSELEG